MLPALMGIASLASKLGGIGQAHDYRPARAAELTQFALSGDLTAARIVYKQQTASHTDAGRSAYQAGWAQIRTGSPALAQLAEQQGGLDDDGHGMANAPPTGLSAELSQLGRNLADDVATSVSRIGTGATNQAAGAVAQYGNHPDQPPMSVPIDHKTLLYVALALVALVLVVYGLRR